MLKKVISGGQCGADRLGLEIAKELGIETGGTAPKSYRTEIGNDYTLKEFGLTEDSSVNYNPRTEKNVINSDGTLLLGDMESPGSRKTIEYLSKHKKKYITNPTVDEIYDFIKTNNIETLNVAGNRASKLTMGKMYEIVQLLREGFKKCINDN
jgi:hypothetical protein